MVLAAQAESGAWRDITVVLVDDAVIRAAKQEHFGRREVTDVVSVDYDPLPGEAGGRDGDILVNVEQALREGAARAARGKGSPDRELALYIAHGCDHLCGGRDDDERGRRAMRRRELTWLRETFDHDGPRLLTPVS